LNNRTTEQPNTIEQPNKQENILWFLRSSVVRFFDCSNGLFRIESFSFAASAAACKRAARNSTMAGHSKWAKVKHFKGAIDAKRARIFAKLSREITIAARIAGGDPDLNPRLRLALLKSRSANMPSDNVERAIKKGLGETGGTTYEDLTYEIYGPAGVALLVELSTDNRNRTAAEIRSLVGKNNAAIATPGSVSRLFDRKGQIIVTRDASSEDALMELALDAGADDFKSDPDVFEIVTEPSQFENVHRAIEARGIKSASAEVTWLAKSATPVSGPEAAAVQTLIEALEEHDDVKEVHSNADFIAAAS
jgi:YebC/PmpR family DNA-binding regulatory protein